jgi:hypothetical protein
MLEVKIPISADDIIEAVKKMKKYDREAFIEDLLALTSPEYCKALRRQGQSIKPAKRNLTKKYLVNELSSYLYPQG